MSQQARAQFERLYATGAAPVTGQPGAFAVNLVDRKLWTFDGGGLPVKLALDLDFHDPSRSYKIGDVAIETDALYRAGTNIPPGPFNPAQWLLLSGVSTAIPNSPAASGVRSGGIIGLISGNQIQVAAGTGVIVNVESPTAISRTEVAWGALSASIPSGGASILAITIDAAGSLGAGAIANLPILSRDRIILGYVTFDSTGAITAVRNVPRVTSQSAADVGDLVVALGGAFKLSGGRLSHVSGMALAMAAGTVFDLHGRWRSVADNPNIANLSASSPIVFDVIRTNGEVISAATSAVPSNVWQGGAQPPGLAVVHYLFGTPTGDKLWLQVGQTLYADPTAAEAVLPTDWATFTPSFPPGSPIVVLGAIIVAGGATNLGMMTQSRILTATTGPRVSLGFEASGFAGDFLLADGSVSMTGDLDVGGNQLLSATLDEGTF